MYLDTWGGPRQYGTAIWCRRLDKWDGHVRIAVMLSALRGYDGMLGLHAADEEAEAFYEVINALRRQAFRKSPAGVAAQSRWAMPRVDQPYSKPRPKARERCSSVSDT